MGPRAAGVFPYHCTCRLISVQAFREAALAAVNESAPAALPAQSDGCGGAGKEKAPINVEAHTKEGCYLSGRT